MNADKNIIRSVVESGIKQAVSFFENKNNGDTLSDIYIKIDRENGKILIYDDMENLLSEKTIDIWSEENDDTERFDETFIKASKPVLNELNRQNLFDKPFILKPFSISLVDDNFILTEELIFVDDETLKLDGDSLIDLDKELDDFLKDLLKDFD